MTTLYEFCVGFTKLGVGVAPASAPTITVVDSANNVLVAALTATTALTNLTGVYRYSYSGSDGLICYAKFTTTDLTVDQYEIFTVALINPIIQNIHDTDLPAVKSDTAAILADTGTDGVLLTSAYDKAKDDVLTPLAVVDGNVGTIVADYARRTGDYAPASEYDTELVAIQADLDNPDQYKADVSSLALEATLTAMKGAGWTDETLAALMTAIEAISAGGGLDAAGVRAAIGMANADLDTQLGTVAKTGADSDTLETLSDQIDALTVGAGVGAVTWVYNLKDNLGAAIPDASVWVTSDSAGLTVLASGTTDASGNVTFYLDAGTVYVWSQKSGYNFTNPDTEVVA